MEAYELPWNMLVKKLIWRQLGAVQGKHILDFGSGEGITADYLAAANHVVAVEPDPAMINAYAPQHGFTQIIGDAGAMRQMAGARFDMVVCHNVLEYIDDKPSILRELGRLLKPGGRLSLIKHNRSGRVMQMVVLLNNFEHAKALLNSEDGHSQQFGAIRYYTAQDLESWALPLVIEKTYGLRTFYHLQQNQENHNDAHWQNQMLEMEMRAGENPEFQNVASFHHHILRKPI